MNKKLLLSGTGVIIAAVLAVAVIILANATLTSWRLDLTENKLFTLSDGTLNIIHSLEEPVTLDELGEALQAAFAQRKDRLLIIRFPRLCKASLPERTISCLSPEF